MKALLVDDSKLARVALKAVLRKKGLDVLTADSGEAALDVLKNNSVDLVLMDHTMPGMGGMEATRRIKSNNATSQLPVVLCTSNEGETFEHEASQAGATAVLGKPPQADKLQSILDNIEHNAEAAKVDIPSAIDSPRKEHSRAAEQVSEATSVTELKPWVEKSLNHTVMPLVDHLGTIDEQIAAISQAQSETQKLLQQADLSELAGKQQAIDEQLIGLQQQLSNQQETIEQLQQQLHSLPTAHDVASAVNESEAAINENITTIRDNQAGMAEKINQLNDMAQGPSADELMRKVYRVVGIASFILLAAMISLKVLA